MNTRAVALVARSSTRRRLGSLVLLALLTALVTGVVLAGVAGAHRSATVLDRYREATNQADVGVGIYPHSTTGSTLTGATATEATTLVRGIPGVRDAASVANYLGMPDRPGVGKNFVIVAGPDGRYGTEVNRALVTDGRMPNPDRADEVALNEPAARALHLGAGDRFSVRTLTPAAFQRLIANEPIEIDGPVIPLRVVGVVRLGDDLQGSTQQSSPLALATPAFGRAYDGKVAVNGSTTVVRIDDPAAVDRLRTAVAGFPDSSVATAAQSWLDTTRAAVGVVVVALLVFAAAALLAGSIAVGQAVSRQVSAGSGDLRVVRAMGLTRAERVAAVGLPPLVAALVGTALGVGVAIALSGLFPVAVARAAEPDPGVRVDVAVLAAGWLAAAVALTLWTVWSARRLDRRLLAHGFSPTAARRGWSVVPLGARLAPRLGVRLAVDRWADGGRAGVPTRSALLGVAVGIAGVVAAVVFLSSLQGGLARTADYGWTWSSRPDQAAGDGFELLKSLAPDKDLDAVGGVFTGDGRVAGKAVPLQAFYASKGSLVPPVLDGRLPANDGEVALGSSVLRDTGRSIGDRVKVSAEGGRPRTVEIVGEVVGNQLTSLPDLGDVAVVTPQAMATLAGVPDVASLVQTQNVNGSVVLTYRPGVATAPLERRLAEQYHLEFMPYSHPTAPGRLLSMDDMRSLLVGLGAFFALLGTVGLIHLLVVSTRRRSHEFGILAALGMVRGQRRSVVGFQALTVIGVGLVVGVPVGFVVGRVSWRAAIADLGMVVSPASPWVTVALLAGGAVVATWLIALVPGSWAARARPAELLRTE
jgi:hypothetical protein